MTTVARKQLRRIFRIVPGATPASHHPDYWGGDIRWVTPEDFASLDSNWLWNTRRTLTDAGYRSCSATLAPAHSLVVTKRAPIGEVALLANEACSNQGCLLLVPRGKIDTRFYYYWFSAHTEYLRTLGSGSTFMEIDADTLKSLRVPHPPYRQQRAISDHLDQQTARITTLISAKEGLIAILQEKRRAVVTRAVTQGVNRNVGPKAASNSYLDAAPRHWTRCTLKRVLVGMDYGISTPITTDGPIGVVRMGNLRDGEIDYAGLGFVDQVDSELILQDGDLLFNRTNSRDHVGKVALFRGNSEYPISFASYLVRLRCGPSVLPEYLNYLLNSAFPRAWGRAEALQSIGQANLNPRHFGYLPIVLPPMVEQEEIVKYLARATSCLRRLRFAVESAINLLQERRSSLIVNSTFGYVVEGRSA